MTKLLYVLGWLAGFLGLLLFVFGAAGTYTIIADQFDPTNIAAGMGALALPTMIVASLAGTTLLIIAWLLVRLARRRKSRELSSRMAYGAARRHVG